MLLSIMNAPGLQTRTVTGTGEPHTSSVMTCWVLWEDNAHLVHWIKTELLLNTIYGGMKPSETSAYVAVIEVKEITQILMDA